jgi:hypothetical protein
MNPQVQDSNNPNASDHQTLTEAGHSTAKMDVNLEQPGTLVTLPMNENEAAQQWQQILDRVTAILSGLPDYVGEFFGEYKRPITTVGIVIGSTVAVKVTLAVLDAINDVPLLAPVFELVGMGYSAWFIYRYLLKASNRQELSADFQQLKDQVLGQSSTNKS